MVSIREKQMGALKLMMNLQELQPKLSSSELVWKILIFDKCGQDIISPILSKNDLRELGVTLFLQLHSKRDPIPHVPVIYFCLPTEENLNRICQDFQSNLYDSYYLNFISAISRQNLEDLATAAIQYNCTNSIQKIYDQYLNFICLEQDFFVLRNYPNDEEINYFALNKCNVKDSQIETIIDKTVDGLFSVFATWGSVPIIRCPKNNAAEMISEKLNKKMYENLKDTRNNLFLNMNMTSSAAGSSSSNGDNYNHGLNFNRPLLIILDRNVDMATPLHHTWTYQALAHDVLNLNLNRIVLNDNTDGGAAASSSTNSKKIDLNDSDSFWCQHKGSPFPTVAEAIQEELEILKANEDEVKNIKNQMDDPSSMSVNLNDNTAKLSSAIQNLPQLLEKKRIIDMHTSVATNILNEIKSRRLDTLFEIEEKIMSRITLDRTIYELLNDEFGNINDKLRLFLIYYICNPNITDNEVDKCIKILQDQSCNLNAFEYIKRWKQYNNITSTHALNTNSGGYNDGSIIKTKSMFSKLVSQGSSFVMEGVKNLIVKKYNLPITKIVNDIYNTQINNTSNNNEINKTYKYYDPKLSNTNMNMNSNMNTTSNINVIIVFMLGAGNYIEYENLIQYTKKNNDNIKIIYSASTLCNSYNFLKQLDMLGEQILQS